MREGYGRWVVHPVLPHSCLCPVRPVSCPRMPMGPTSLSQTNTSVSRPQSPHQSDHLAWRISVIIHHRLLGKGQEGQSDKAADPVTAISITTGMCWKNRESERDRERSEREGEVNTDLSGKGRQEGGRTPSFFLWKIRGCVWAHLDGLEELKGLM